MSRSVLAIHSTSIDEKVGGVSLKYNFVQDPIFFDILVALGFNVI